MEWGFSGISLLVSTIIPAYNSAQFLREAIDSALAQTHVDNEVIVVNDGSTDSTSEILNSYHQRIVVINQENCGISGARNAGIARSRGNFIAFLDADDRWSPDKLAKQLALFDSADVGIVHGAIRLIDSTGTLRDFVQLEKATDVHVLMESNRIAVCTAVVSRKALDYAGLFCQTTSPCEDWDLWIRIAAAFSIKSVEDCVAYYRVHDGNISSNMDRMYYARLKVLRRARDIHQSCSACDDAIQLGLRNTRYWYRNKKKEQWIHLRLAGTPWLRSLCLVFPRNLDFLATWPKYKMAHWWQSRRKARINGN